MFRGLSFIFCFCILMISCSTPKTAEPKLPSTKEVVNSPETVLVDVRIPEEFQEATAENAINIPLDSIVKNLDFFRKQKQVVVFCNRGRQADEAIKILKDNGINNVTDGTTWKNVKAIQEENKKQ